MDKDEREHYQTDAKSYLEKVSDRYVFDEASRLYIQQTVKHDDNRSTDTTGHYERFPFWVNVHRDWLALIVSVLTLLFLVGTVYYTRKQWIEANKSAKAAQWSQYLDCLNAHTAQTALQSARDSTALAQASTEASIAQAAAGIEAQRAVLTHHVRLPQEGEIIDGRFGFPFTIRNDGRSAAHSFRMGAKAILVRNDQTLPDDWRDNIIADGELVTAGEEIPAKSDDKRFQSIFSEIPVEDINGKTLDIASPDIQLFFRGDVAIFIFGHLSYSDFSGHHFVQFCGKQMFMQAGTFTDNNSSNEKRCTEHNSERDISSWRRTLPKQSVTEDSNAPPICQKPED